MAGPSEKPSAQPRTFHHSRYPAEQLSRVLASSGLSASVCLPARECAETVGEIVGELAALRARGVVSEIVVIDAASADGTAQVAAGAGATVLQEAELMPERGPVLGKGDAMWRALPLLSGELVCFVDADTEAFAEHFVTGLLGPLACEPGVSLVKAFYRRPLRHGELSVPEGGGRVNHLAARPALALFYPQLTHINQPLAGEIAARRDLLWRLPFATGYGVEIAMLIDALHELGIDGIAQVDLDEHRNKSQPLSALTPMAFTVLATIVARVSAEGRLEDPDLAARLESLVERPAHASIDPLAAPADGAPAAGSSPPQGQA